MKEHWGLQESARIDQCIESAVSGQLQQRREAAAELSRMGIWKRQTIRPRGTLSVPAKSRLPKQGALRRLLRAFIGETEIEVRCQLALAVAEWGDETAAVMVRDLLASAFGGKNDLSETTQLYFIATLRTIGGLVAVEALSQCLEKGVSIVKDAAVLALEELATGGRIEDIESPLATRRGALDQTETHTLKRTSAVLGTGAKEVNIHNHMIGALQRVHSEAENPAYTRRRAAELMTFLKGY